MNIYTNIPIHTISLLCRRINRYLGRYLGRGYLSALQNLYCVHRYLLPSLAGAGSLVHPRHTKHVPATKNSPTAPPSSAPVPIPHSFPTTLKRSCPSSKSHTLQDATTLAPFFFFYLSSFGTYRFPSLTDIILFFFFFFFFVCPGSLQPDRSSPVQSYPDKPGFVCRCFLCYYQNTRVGRVPRKPKSPATAAAAVLTCSDLT